MTTRHRVDAELLPLLDLMNVEWTPGSLAERRATFDSMQAAAELTALPAAIVVEDIAIPGTGESPAVPILLIRPTTTKGPRPAILHIHGGGYILGSAQLYQPQLARLADRLGAVIVSVNYRLAPETPFPGAIEDCYAALRWLAASADELAVDHERIVVAGESAGGGLAAALAILARDRGEVALAGQMLVFPMLDDRTGSTLDVGPHAGEFIWTRAANRFGWEALLGHAPGTGAVSPYAAAARCEDLSGLPPAFLAVGDLDLFLEENLEYARRLARAGVPLELRVYAGAVHGFMLVEDSRLAKAFSADQLAAYRRFLKVDHAPATME